jgi:hypothetical protein
LFARGVRHDGGKVFLAPGPADRPDGGDNVFLTDQLRIKLDVKKVWNCIIIHFDNAFPAFQAGAHRGGSVTSDEIAPLLHAVNLNVNFSHDFIPQITGCFPFCPNMVSVQLSAVSFQQKQKVK